MEARGAGPALPFEALVFDVGGVLVRHDNEELFRRLAAGCTAPAALEKIRAYAGDPRISTGERTVAALHRALCRDLGYSRGWHEFLADWSSHFVIDQGMFDLLRRLSADRRVLLFSNTNREHWHDLLERTGGALGGFEAYLSFEIGDVKPSLAAFRLVAARARIAPERALFVDDLAENVAAAERVGFHGHAFIDQPTLERFLGARAARR